MSEKRYSLGNSKARNIHSNIINSPNSYSLTLTLKPYYNALPINEQFNKMIQDTHRLFTNINRTYNIIMITPELTKDYNIHLHAYLQLPIDEDYIRFLQSFKKHLCKRSVIGRNFKLKKIDCVTDKLTNYPFKDIERTKHVKNRLDGIGNLLFTPYHLILTGFNSWKII